MSEPPIDINLDDPANQGPDWVFQPEFDDGHYWAWIHRRTGHLLLMAKKGSDPPTEWEPV